MIEPRMFYKWSRCKLCLMLRARGFDLICRHVEGNEVAIETESIPDNEEKKPQNMGGGCNEYTQRERVSYIRLRMVTSTGKPSACWTSDLMVHSRFCMLLQGPVTSLIVRACVCVCSRIGAKNLHSTCVSGAFGVASAEEPMARLLDLQYNGLFKVLHASSRTSDQSHCVCVCSPFRI